MKSKHGETTLADVVQSVHELTKEMKVGFAKLTREVTEVKGSADRLGKKFDRLEKRFEHSLLTSGARGLDHEARITRLEQEVEDLKGL